MLVVNRDKTVILNIDNVCSLYIGGNNCSIKYNTENGGGQLETYPNPQTTTEAMNMLVEKLGSAGVYVMPTVGAIEENIRQKNSENMQEKFNFKGHKTKNHGGS